MKSSSGSDEIMSLVSLRAPMRLAPLGRPRYPTYQRVSMSAKIFSLPSTFSIIYLNPDRSRIYRCTLLKMRRPSVGAM